MPSLAGQHDSQDQAGDSLIAATSASSNAYNSDTTEGPSTTTDLPEHDRNMGRFALPSRAARDISTLKSSIDIKVDTPFLTLRGIGPDVEATHLSGNVELFLAETTSIKEITLEFRGKARVPVPGNESLINNSTSLTYSVCNHTWSFLDLRSGTKHVTSRTLKAGRHLFPFSLEIGGSLPSSISVPLSGASVSYKLHALAALPTKLHIPFHHNLHHTTPITILRSFAESALEYQQTLEIENTWPGKLMYSIVLPHKAWAQGDTLGVLVKFSPTAKGVGVHSVLTNIEEKTRVYARSGEREEKRIVASAKHEIIGKRALLVDTNKPGLWIGCATPPRSPATTPSRGPESVSAEDPNPSNNLTSPSSQDLHPQSAAAGSSSVPDPEGGPSSTTNLHASPTDIVTTLLFPLPSSSPTMIPSHSLEPITVTHRIRWAIYISNPDGHISELRCSLPIIIMDGRLLAESRMHTAVTRRIVLSSGGMADSAIAGTSDSEGDGGLAEPVGGLEVEDRELPSYHAHVRDRVANMYFPEGAAMRVNNPWVTNGTSPTSSSTPGFADTVPITGMFDGALNDRLARGDIWGSTGLTPESISADPSDAQGVVNTNEGCRVVEPSGLTVSAFSASLATLHLRSPYPTPPRSSSSSANIFSGPCPTSGHATPQEPTAGHVMLHLPHAPGNGESTPLDWVNSELLLSLSDEPHRRFEREIEISRRGGGPSSESASAPNSRGPSRPMTPVGGESRPSSSHGKHGLSSFLKGAMKGFGFTKRHPHSQSGSSAASGAPSPGSISRTNSRTDSPDLDRPMRLPPTRNMSTGVESTSAVLPSPFQYGSYSASNQGGPGSGVSMPRSMSTSMLSSMAQVSTTTLTLLVTPNANPDATGAPELHHRTSNNDPDEHLLHRAFTEVPDYAVAARGFIGGVAPLSSLIGLPSYADVTRERAREATFRLQ